MAEIINYDLAVNGAGTGGLVGAKKLDFQIPQIEIDYEVVKSPALQQRF